MGSLSWVFGAGALALAVGGCAGASDPSENAAIDEAAESLATSTGAYVAVRRDLRKCASPMCGGWFVHELNRATAERYVSELDVAALGWNGDDTSRYLGGAEDGAVILKGTLGRVDARSKTRPFVVAEAYRGMPGVRAARGDAFWTVAAREPQIRCITAPCPNEIASKVNRSARIVFDGVDVSAAALAFVDRAWLTSRVAEHGAIVAGHFERGAHFPGGDASTLAASQVFVRLPDTIGPCPAAPVHACAEGEVTTFTRNEDRCLVADGCVQPGVCPLYIPVCPDGYAILSWPAAPRGCNAYACDPAFIAR